MKPKPKLLTFWAFVDSHNDVRVRKVKTDAERELRSALLYGPCGELTKIQLPAAGGWKKP